MKDRIPKILAYALPAASATILIVWALLGTKPLTSKEVLPKRAVQDTITATVRETASHLYPLPHIR